jgi:uracil-DNA glycosylase
MRATTLNRETTYRSLVAARRSCAACAGLRNPAAIAGGAFDHGEIGPWSAWQGRLDSPIMVVGQDYSDDRYFERRKGIEDPSNRTNLNLVTLLGSIGFPVTMPGERRGRGEAFFTNAILFLKQGGMQAPVRDEWFRNCGTRFLRSQIELVRPNVVVGLGERAFNSVLAAFDLPKQRLRDAILESGTRLPAGAMAVAVYHCGARVVNVTRNLPRQRQDWQRVLAALGAPAA